jgi:hypothetical protein
VVSFALFGLKISLWCIKCSDKFKYWKRVFYGKNKFFFNKNNIQVTPWKISKFMPSSENNSFLLLSRIWFIIAMFIILFISFGLYVHSEKLIDQANLQRQVSYKLADHLRQSSDDLSQMARSYVGTKDPRYKKYYHDILDIRNGTKPKPDGYSDIYWDLVLANEKPHATDNKPALSLLEEMQQSGFSDRELSKMAEAIDYSNHLAALEIEAMKLIEDDGPDAEINRTRANLILRNEEYYHAKLMIMKPINEFYAQVNAPNRDAVRDKKDHALFFRLIFIFVSLITVFLLWRFYQELHTTLGASADEIHALMLKIGRGNFSTPINITSDMPIWIKPWWSKTSW